MDILKSRFSRVDERRDNLIQGLLKVPGLGPLAKGKELLEAAERFQSTIRQLEALGVDPYVFDSLVPSCHRREAAVGLV